MGAYTYLKYAFLILAIYSTLPFYAWITLLKEKKHCTSKDEIHKMIKEMFQVEILNNQRDKNRPEREDVRTGSAAEEEHTSSGTPTGLVLFSTWGNKKGKEHVRKNVLLNWRKWAPSITPVLIADNHEVRGEARSYKWHLQNVTETSCLDSKMPTLRGMFQNTMSVFGQRSTLVGFCNGDLLFDDGLNATISALLKSESEIIRTRPVLILVKRINVKIDDNMTLTNLSLIRKLAKAGHYPGEGSSDVFITNYLFPWKRVPDIVIGRLGFGMWIVAFARANNVTTYDLTKTVTAIHLTDSYGSHESSSASNAWCNHQLINRNHIKPTSYWCGYIDCSSKRSEYDKYGNIVFKDVDLKTMDPGCHKCDHD